MLNLKPKRRKNKRMKEPQILSADEYVERLQRRFSKAQYDAMYSSLVDAIVKDRACMTVPIDDHVVHRGDGVFESLKAVSGSVYNMDAHIDRLSHSAQRLGIQMPCSVGRLKELVLSVLRAGGRKDSAVRILLTRGPGSLGVSPYDCPESALYIVCAKLPQPFMQVHPEGATACISSVPLKHPFYATIKNCNYLPNVMMKKEAQDAGVDFSIAFDERGYLAEGSTANVAVVTNDNELLTPGKDCILTGTTMTRVLQLAKQYGKPKLLSDVREDNINKSMVVNARELFMVGTTIDVTAVVQLNGRNIGNGRPGPVYQELSEILRRDILSGANARTSIG